jgi:hypothetical protein
MSRVWYKTLTFVAEMSSSSSWIPSNLDFIVPSAMTFQPFREQIVALVPVDRSGYAAPLFL